MNEGENHHSRRAGACLPPFCSNDAVHRGGTKAPPYNKIRRFVRSSLASQSLLNPVGEGSPLPPILCDQKREAKRLPYTIFLFYPHDICEGKCVCFRVLREAPVYKITAVCSGTPSRFCRYQKTDAIAPMRAFDGVGYFIYVSVMESNRLMRRESPLRACW